MNKLFLKTDYVDWGVFDAFQIPYSALERDHEDPVTPGDPRVVDTVVAPIAGLPRVGVSMDADEAP